MSVNASLDKLMSEIDAEGQRLKLDQWIDLLEALKTECDSRLQAALDDARQSEKRPPQKRRR